jgi:hypothetical protein
LSGGDGKGFAVRSRRGGCPRIRAAGVGDDGRRPRHRPDLAGRRPRDARLRLRRVEAVGYASGFSGYGNVVLVDMGSGIEALYAHLSSIGVHVGEEVVPGEKLGNAGCTGYCTGTHLHFELRDDGTAFDPAPLLPRQPR